jgi:hypothetical protein
VFLRAAGLFLILRKRLHMPGVLENRMRVLWAAQVFLQTPAATRVNPCPE